MEHIIKTHKEDEMINITSIVRDTVKESNVISGIVTVFVPHTTAGVTINESYDPDVVTDILSTLKKLVPENPHYLHLEGNSHAHMKASIIGSSCTIIIENGDLKLGTWQGVFFCEFDGPRRRTFYTKVIGEKWKKKQLNIKLPI